MKRPKVFISYSHDSVEHKRRVLELADRLRNEGVDCRIDQYETVPRLGWPEWMTNQLCSVDFVLVVCTQGYDLKIRRKEPIGRGRGAKWEGAIITSLLYQSELRNNKIIPVVFSEADAEYIPIVLRATTYFDVGTRYDSLYGYLTGQLDNIKPSLGKLRSLPSRDHKQRQTLDIYEARREPDAYLLSNSLDRREQVYGFRTAMHNHHRLNPHRPFVCILHGNEKECHPEFMIRLRQLLLPEVFESLALGLAEDVVSERHPMKLRLGELDHTNYKKLLWEDLRKAFNFHGLQSEDDVRRLITLKKSAVIVDVQLETKHWEGVDLQRLNWFLKFWEGEDWQNLPENFLLLVCLSCEYTKESERTSSNPNDQMRAYIERLDDNGYPGVYVARIDELTAIELQDARLLVDEPSVRRFYDFDYRDIDKLYREPGLCVAPGRIQMADLLDQLGRFRRAAKTGGDRMYGL